MNEKEYYKNNYNHVKLQLDENKEKMKKVKEELSKYINLFNEKNNFNINNEKKSNVIFNYCKFAISIFKNIYKYSNIQICKAKL